MAESPLALTCEISRGNTKRLGWKHVLEFSYTWTINDMNVIINEAIDVIKSPVFSPTSSNELKWSLRLYPYGNNDNVDFNRDLITSLFLYLEQSNKSKVRAQCTFSTIGSDGEKSNSMCNEEPYTFERGKEMQGFEEFIEFHLLNENQPYGVLVDDKLTILCEIKIIEDFDDMMENSSNVTPCNVPTSRLLKDVELLFETRQYTDFKIIVNEEEFPVHRAILSTRSSVFSAMFEHDMKERKQNSVEIIDMNSEVLKEMLRFIYTDKVENIEKIAEELLAAADKYALERLKNMCEEAASASLKIENAADLLILADVHSADQLKLRAIEFITKRDNTTDVMATTGFTSMISSHPHLLAEILRAMVARRN